MPFTVRCSMILSYYERQMLLLIIRLWITRWDFSCGSAGKEPTCQSRRCKRCGFDPWVRRIPWNRKWQLTPVFLPGKFLGQRSLGGYSPWGCKESDMTEQTHTWHKVEILLIVRYILLSEQLKIHTVLRIRWNSIQRVVITVAGTWATSVCVCLCVWCACVQKEKWERERERVNESESYFCLF